MVQAVPVIVTPEDGASSPASRRSSGRVLLHQGVDPEQPNNPSGAVFPRSSSRTIVGFCEKKGIWADHRRHLIHKLVFDGRSRPPRGATTEKDVESTKVLVVNGVSKL